MSEIKKIATRESYGKALVELGEKYDFSDGTAMKILEYLKIEIYKPSHQFAFINEEQKEKFEDFLKGFSSLHCIIMKIAWTNRMRMFFLPWMHLF